MSSQGWKEPSGFLKDFCKDFNPQSKLLVSAVMRDPDFIGALSQRTQEAGVKSRAELLLAGMAVYEDEIRSTLVEGGLAEEKSSAVPAESSASGEVLSLLKELVNKVDDVSRRVESVEKIAADDAAKLRELFPSDTLRGKTPAMLAALTDARVMQIRTDYSTVAERFRDLGDVVKALDNDFSTMFEACNRTTRQVVSLTAKVDSLLVREVESVPSASATDPALVEKISALADELRASKIEAEERRKASVAAAERRKAELAAAKLAREAEIAKRRAEKKEKQRLAAEARVASKAKKEEVRAKKARGENPYTPEEQAAFRAKLEKKGKTYYTPEQRAAFKAANPVTPGGAAKKAGKQFRFYTEAQKAQFIHDNFTSKGRTYYTKEQRRIFREKSLKAAKAAKGAAVS